VSEQRKHDRIVASFLVTCLQPNLPPFEGKTKDISLGGTFVECETLMPFGSRLTLRVRGLAQREVDLPAVVRWSKPGGFGVQFGLLGAYETFALVALSKKTAP
jgi:hypothetical protein